MKELEEEGTKSCSHRYDYGWRKGSEEIHPRQRIKNVHRKSAFRGEKYPELFDFDDPRDAFSITDDFMSTGRISGAKGIPIAELKVNSFHSVEGKDFK